MKAAYEDIKEKIKQEPIWYDTHGVPRYKLFHPKFSPNIYATECCLVKIRCQYCEQEFLVELNASDDNLKRLMKQNDLYCGDPPRHDCVGDTMTCDEINIVEFWERNGKCDWKRNKKYEVKL